MAGVGRLLGLRGIGMATRGSISVFNSGDAPPPTTTTGTDLTTVVTETYLSRIFIPVNATLTGLSVLNGSAVAGSLTLALYDSTGAVVARTASTAQAGVAAYQQIAFTAPYEAIGPGIYFAAVQSNNTSARLRTHTLGNFTTGKQTAGTYGTFVAFTSPNSFSTGVGPIISTY
jgi:hypothetical protein